MDRVFDTFIFNFILAIIDGITAVAQLSDRNYVWGILMIIFCIWFSYNSIKIYKRDYM